MHHVDHMHQHVALADLVEGALEAFDQVVGQLANESDRVGKQHLPVGAQLNMPRGGVERGEETVFGKHVGIGQYIHQGGLARVRIPDQRDAGKPCAPLALDGALPVDLFQPLLEDGDPVPDEPAVSLDLRFSRSLRADAALLAGKVRPVPRKARPEIIELRQFDLGLRGRRASPCSKNIQNQPRAVEQLAVERLFQVANLHRGQVVVENDEIAAARPNQVLQFSDLARPDVGRRIHPGEGLRHPIGNDGAGCGGQFGQFVERVVDVPSRGIRRHDAHKHRRFSIGKFVFVQREGRAWDISEDERIPEYFGKTGHQ